MKYRSNAEILSEKKEDEIILDIVKKENKWTDGSDVKKFVQDVGLVGIAEIAVALGGIILIPLLTKTLGAYGYGLWQQMLVTVGILSPLASFGLNNSLVRFLPAKINKLEKQNIFLSIFIFKFSISCIIAFLLIIFSEPVAKIFFDGANYIVVITGFIFLVGSPNILCQFYFRSLRQIKTYSIIRILDSFSKIALAYYMIISGHGIFGVIFSYFVIETFFTLISLFLVVSQIGISFPRFTGMKTWLRYGIPLIPTGLSLWVISFSDRYVIGYVLGVSSVGVYSAAYAIGFSFFMLMELINFVLVPTISKHFDEGKIHDVKKYLGNVLKFYLLFAIPAVIGLSVVSKQILAIITTPDIAEAAWMITPIIATCTLFAGVQEVYDKTLRLTKRTTRIGLAVTISAVINLSLNFILIPIYGILGAAVATLIAYGLSAVLMTFFSIKEFRFEIEKKAIFKFVFAALLMASIGVIWHPVTTASLILCILICIAFYFFILFCLGVFKLREIKFLLKSLFYTK